MPRDPDAFAEMVALTIKAAMTPILERVAGLEARLQQALAVEQHVTTLRDRVVAVETKALTLPPLAPETHVDLMPIMERLAAVDARLARVAALELTVDEMKDRILTIETKASIPVEPRVVGPTASELELMVIDALEPVQKSLAAVQERVAVMEVRGQIPGPPGKDGASGLNGKDGADGVGFDDLDVEFDGDRTIALKFSRGSEVKTWPIVLPYQRYQGTYQQGKAYNVGDTVTWGNQMWHCNESTVTAPGDGSKFWTLCVRKGRDGKDGRDAQTLPVVSFSPLGKQ